MSNNECRMSKGCILPVVSLCVERSILKKTEQSDSTLRHSAVRYSIFCGSLVLKLIKRSVINIRRSMLDVQSFTVPAT
jgi:hypothetical protein